MTFDDDKLQCRVLPYTPGVSPQLVTQHLCDAARIYCRRTFAWIHEHAAITTVAGQAAYTLTLPAGTELVRVETCEIEDGPCYSAINGARGRQSTRRGQGNLAAVSLPSTIVLTPPPTIGGQTLMVDLVLAPDDSAQAEWPAELDSEATYIASGALSTLCAMPRVEWTDLPTAALQNNIFQARMNSAYHRSYAASTTRGRTRSVQF